MTILKTREMTTLRKLVLHEGALVEEAIEKTIRAFRMRSEELAEEVIDGDTRIDEMEIEVEEECLKILALHTPVAVDLRHVVAVLKLNNDLERMGDIAVSIARRARFLAKRPPVDIPDQFETMASAVRSMVKQCLDALINGDVDMARAVCEEDDHVDDLKREVKQLFRQRIYDDVENLQVHLKLMDVPRHLERIADLATNVAEDVIYMVTGEIIRHQRVSVLDDHEDENR